MQQLEIFQIDAFTQTRFGGNPAAVCPLNQWLPDELMLKIAAENNLSEVDVYENEKAVRELSPDMNALMNFEDARGIIATAKGDNDVDFVSRFFGPRVGVPEDPVTGSAHCILAPIWSKILNKTDLKARQISKRGGDLFCTLMGDRVEITGQAVLYMKGSIRV